jgi:hypothetical protein
MAVSQRTAPPLLAVLMLVSLKHVILLLSLLLLLRRLMPISSLYSPQATGTLRCPILSRIQNEANTFNWTLCSSVGGARFLRLCVSKNTQDYSTTNPVKSLHGRQPCVPQIGCPINVHV